MNKLLIQVLIKTLIVFLSFSVSADNDIIESKRLSLRLAVDIASTAIAKCNKDGYQVSAVIVDRSGNEQVTLRDDYASRFTIQIAEEKANAVILSGVPSGQFRKSRNDIRSELNHMDGIIIMQGGLPITSSGTLLAAIGISGAPGGDKDEACAKYALDKFEERLEFAD